MTSDSGLYDRLAPSYDRSGLGGHARRIRPLVEALLAAPPPPAGRWVDLGCGTGILLADGVAGRRGAGLDRSAGMLAAARRRGLAVAAGDVRRLPLAPAVVAVATATFDLPNHMAGSDELALFFAEVVAILVPGGVFVFDANTPDHLRLWDGAEQSERGPDGRVLLSTSGRFEDRRGLAEVRFRDEGGAPLGSLRERAFPAGLVESLLRRAGFAAIRRVEARRARGATLRWLWRADREPPVTAGS